MTTRVLQVAKKAFEAVAARSLRGISDVVSEHYKGDKEVCSAFALPLKNCKELINTIGTYELLVLTAAGVAPAR